jgi:peptidoglycan/xylan/chitin deacetylase (PgdA/CDA1 family)
MISSLLLVICIGLIVLFFFKDSLMTSTGGDYITDLEISYNADAEIAQASERMRTSQDKAKVITRNNNGQRHVALTFDGLTDRTTIQQILDLLKKYNARATFFVDGLQTAEDPQTVANIKKEGHRIENYTLSGLTKMEKLPVERLIKDFSRAQKIIKVNTDQGPNLLKCNDTVYTNELLKVAKACGFSYVVKSDAFLNVSRTSSPAAADSFIGGLRPGYIVSVRLKPNVEAIVTEPGKTDLKPAIDKQPGLKELPPPEERREKEVVAAVERFLAALQKANYTTTYVEDSAQINSIRVPAKTSLLPGGLNGVRQAGITGLLQEAAVFLREQIFALFSLRTAYAAELTQAAAEIKVISTTEPALSFTFGGLANEAVVNDVLGRLNTLGIKATFFVAEIEMRRYPQTVRRIIENGHELGIAIRPKDGEATDATTKTIEQSRKLLQEKFGVTTNLVRQSSGVIEDTTKQAVVGSGCILIGQAVNAVQSKHKDYTCADQVMAEIFGKYVYSLSRGQIVYFRMDYYTNGRLVGDLLEAVKQRKVDNIAYVTSYDNPASNPENDSQYVIKPVGAILTNRNFIYQYPADPKNIPVHLRNDGPSITVNRPNFLSEVSKRYIGHEDVDSEDRMIGFSKMEARRLDTSGFVHTGDTVVFLTFDDWGADAAVNKILYVLRKHSVPATFFVVTNNVLNNPNLLRTIAMEGHEIASHSDQHKPMAVREANTGRQVRTQDKEEYVRDLATAYKKLRDVTGDVMINARPALTRFFRPPTLAVSKMGFEALFEAGYEYIVSGSTSTEDYEAPNVSHLVRVLKDGIYTDKGEIKKGAVLVMHMGDTSVYTAMAVDILLTANAAKPDSDPTKFKVGRLSDYLVEGYFQIHRK